MTRIVIVANFCRGLDGTNHSRFVYLSEMLASSGRFDVELITSDFHHLAKTHIDSDNASRYSFKIKLCHEPGYVSHKGLKRLYSHRKWGKNVIRYIKSGPKPDIIYCAIPSLTAAHDLAAYCKKQGSKFVVDIQDLWPEAIFMLADNRLIRALTLPMSKYIDEAYKNADAIIAVSETYVDRATSVNNKGARKLAVYLGNDGERFSSACNLHSKKDNIFTIGYIGTLSYSYDIGCVIDALNELNSTNKYGPVKFLIMGDGPLRNQFEDKAKLLNVDCEFTGMLTYEEMVGRLCKCDVLVNPIVKGSAATITNKVGDFALSGLPVVNTQECEEYRNLIKEYHCGINCNPGDSMGVAAAIASLIENKNLREEMGRNARRLGLERFDRRTSYSRIVELLTSISSEF